MSEVPVQVVVAAFQEIDDSDNALWELKQAKWDGLIGIQNAAVLRMNYAGKLKIRETGDWGGGKGAAAGTIIGGTIGLLTGPIGWLGLTGAVIGGLAAKLRDSGFSDERLKQLGEALQPGTSALVAVIEHKWVAEMEKQMQEAGADVMTEEISADIAAQLEAGREVAYTALATQDATATARVAAGEDATDVSGLVLTKEGLVAGEAVATEEGVAAEGVVATEEGAVAAGHVATEEGEIGGVVVAEPQEQEEETKE